MILDTDILIDLLRERPWAEAWFSGLLELPAVSGMAALEALYGAQSAAEQRKVGEYLNRLTILWPTDADAQTARLLAPYRLSDGLDLIDAVTAATAVRHSEVLASFNVKHFRAVPGLKIIQPYRRE